MHDGLSPQSSGPTHSHFSLYPGCLFTAVFDELRPQTMTVCTASPNYAILRTLSTEHLKNKTADIRIACERHR